MDEQIGVEHTGEVTPQQPEPELRKGGPLGRTGRPRKVVNWEEVDKLLVLQATQREVAAWFNCTTDTLDNHCKRKFQKTYSEYSMERREIGKVSIRKKMFQLAMSGNVTMLIWWSKNHMGMSDKVGIGGLDSGPITYRHVALWDGDAEEDGGGLPAEPGVEGREAVPAGEDAE